MILRTFPRGRRHLKALLVRTYANYVAEDPLNRIKSINNGPHLTPKDKKAIQEGLADLSQNQHDSVHFYQTLNKLEDQGLLDSPSNEYHLIIFIRILENFKHIQQKNVDHSFSLIDYSLKVLRLSSRILQRPFFTHNGKQSSLVTAMRSINDLFIQSGCIRREQLLSYLKTIDWYMTAVQLFEYNNFPGNLDTIKGRIVRGFRRVKYELLLNSSISQGDYFSAIKNFRFIKENSPLAQEQEVGFDLYRCYAFYKFVSLSISYNDLEGFKLLLRESKEYGRSISLTMEELQQLLRAALFSAKHSLVFEMLLTYPNLAYLLKPEDVANILRKTDDIDVALLAFDQSLNFTPTNEEIIRNLVRLHCKNLVKKPLDANLFVEIGLALDLFLINPNHKQYCDFVFEELLDTFGDQLSAENFKEFAEKVINTPLSYSVQKPMLVLLYKYFILSRPVMPLTKASSIRRYISLIYRSTDLTDDEKEGLFKATLCNRELFVMFLNKSCRNSGQAAGIIKLIHYKYILPNAVPATIPTFYKHVLKKAEKHFDFFNTKEVRSAVYISGVRNACSLMHENLVVYYFYAYLIHLLTSLATDNPYDPTGEVFEKMLTIVFNIVKNKSFLTSKEVPPFSICFMALLNNIRYELDPVFKKDIDLSKTSQIMETVRTMILESGYFMKRPDKDQYKRSDKDKYKKSGRYRNKKFVDNDTINLKDIEISYVYYSGAEKLLQAFDIAMKYHIDRA